MTDLRVHEHEPLGSSNDRLKESCWRGSTACSCFNNINDFTQLVKECIIYDDFNISFQLLKINLEKYFSQSTF